MDDDYQKKRREQLNKKPASAREGFARGGKGLVMVCLLRDWKKFGKYVSWFVKSGIGKCWKIFVMVCLLRDWKMLENMCHGLLTEGWEKVGKYVSWFVKSGIGKSWENMCHGLFTQGLENIGKSVKEHYPFD